MGLSPEEIKAASGPAIEQAQQVEDNELRDDLDREMRERGA